MWHRWRCGGSLKWAIQKVFADKCLGSRRKVYNKKDHESHKEHTVEGEMKHKVKKRDNSTKKDGIVDNVYYH